MKQGQRRLLREQMMSRRVVEYFIAGKSLNEICKLTKRGKRKVAKLRDLAEQHGYFAGVPLPVYPARIFPDAIDRRTLRTSQINDLLLTHKEWIAGKFLEGWSAITVFEELPAKVNRSTFYRFLNRHGIAVNSDTPERITPEIIHQPGEALQVDWGLLRTIVDPLTGKKKRLWAFVGVLGFSRYMMVRLVWTMDTATTLAVLADMLSELGGVPFKVTSDNPKCFALVADRYDPLLNPAYERFAAHYGITIECLPPRDPKKKGKVERLMPYVRRLYEAHGSTWSGIEESQSYLDKKLVLANERRHGTTTKKPIEQFIEVEAKALKPLPALAFEVEEYHAGTVRKDGCLRFRGKYYSVDASYIGKHCIVIGSGTTVSIYCDGKLIETHARLTKGDYQTKSIKPQHLAPWQRSMQETSVYRDRAQRLGAYVDQFITKLLAQGRGFIDFRKVWGVLSLDKTYDAALINEACRLALAEDRLSYRVVKRYLAFGVKSIYNDDTNEIPLISNDDTVRNETNKFVRSLCEYRQIINSKKGKDPSCQLNH